MLKDYAEQVSQSEDIESEEKWLEEMIAGRAAQLAGVLLEDYAELRQQRVEKDRADTKEARAILRGEFGRDYEQSMNGMREHLNDATLFPNGEGELIA